MHIFLCLLYFTVLAKKKTILGRNVISFVLALLSPRQGFCPSVALASQCWDLPLACCSCGPFSSALFFPLSVQWNGMFYGKQPLHSPGS